MSYYFLQGLLFCVHMREVEHGRETAFTDRIQREHTHNESVHITNIPLLFNNKNNIGLHHFKYNTSL